MDYVEKNLKKIIEDEKFPPPLNQAMAFTWLIAFRKGLNLKILDMTHHSSLADYYVLASLESPISATSLGSEIAKLYKKNFHTSITPESDHLAQWTLVDLGDVIIHLFLEHTRDIYNPDALWSKAQIINIPREYYSHPSPEIIKKNDKNSDYLS